MKRAAIEGLYPDGEHALCRVFLGVACFPKDGGKPELITGQADEALQTGRPRGSHSAP